MEFHAREALQITEISYRQLDYAFRSRLLHPARGGRGHGSRRRFMVNDLLALAVLADVLRTKLSAYSVAPGLRLLQRGRRIPALEQLGRAIVWTDGEKAVFMRRPGVAPSAETVGYLLNVGAAAKRVRAGIAAARSTGARAHVADRRPDR